MSEALSAKEREILKQHGHAPEPDFNEERLARRVLELPDTGSDHWYAASAVTLAAAYLELRAALDLGNNALIERMARAMYLATSDNPNAADRFDRAIEWALDNDDGELPAWIVDLKLEATAALRAALSKPGAPQ